MSLIGETTGKPVGEIIEIAKRAAADPNRRFDIMVGTSSTTLTTATLDVVER